MKPEGRGFKKILLHIWSVHSTLAASLTAYYIQSNCRPIHSGGGVLGIQFYTQDLRIS